MKARITKEFKFEAAHSLPFHDGQCADLHGHSYRVKITVRGNVNNNMNSPKYGMVVDFSELKAIWVTHVQGSVDHKFLNDSLDIYTTAENIAARIFLIFQEHLVGAKVTEVEVWETATSSARVNGLDVNQ